MSTISSVVADPAWVTTPAEVSPVSRGYTDSNPYTGTLHEVAIQLLSREDLETLQAKARAELIKPPVTHPSLKPPPECSSDAGAALRSARQRVRTRGLTAVLC